MKPLLDAFTLALLHLAWQGCLAFVLLWIVLFVLRKNSARARYAAACTTLAILALAPALTTAILYNTPTAPYALLAPNLSPPAAAIPAAPLPAAGILASLRPWALPAWAFGVLVFSLRMVWGCTQVAALKRRGQPAGDDVIAIVERLSRRFGLARHARVLISEWEGGPSLVGWIRPVILIPASALTGLTPDQLEAVLAHELAHIRRHDYLVNWMQMLVETLLFYHPAVWWISSRIRHERELCCDDLAVAASEGALCYARALTTLEKLRAVSPATALGSTGGSLLYRIQRLAGSASQPYPPSRASAVVAASLAIAGLLFSVNWARAQSEPSPSYLAQGDILLKAGANDIALQKYLAGLAADPAHRVDYQKRLIETYMRLNRKPDSAAVNAQLLQEHPDNTDALAFGATVLLDQGNLAGAAAQLQRVLQQVPDNPVAHFDLGRVYQAQGDTEAAKREFQTAVNLRPDFIRARQALERVGGQVPDVAGPNVGYAYNAESAAQALPVLQAESDKAPQRVDLLMAVANAAMRAGQNDRAISTYQRLLDRLPSDAPNRGEVYVLVGEAQLRKGDTSAAVDAFKKAGDRIGTIRAIATLEAAGRQPEANQLRAEAGVFAEQRHDATRRFLEEVLQFEEQRIKALQSAPQRDAEAIQNSERQIEELRAKLSAASNGSANWDPAGRVLAEIHTPRDLSLPVRIGDTLTLDNIGATESALQAIDSALEIRFLPAANGAAQLQVVKRR